VAHIHQKSEVLIFSIPHTESAAHE